MRVRAGRIRGDALGEIGDIPIEFGVGHAVVDQPDARGFGARHAGVFAPYCMNFSPMTQAMMPPRKAILAAETVSAPLAMAYPTVSAAPMPIHTA